MGKLDEIREAIIRHPDNAWALELGYTPTFTASETAKIMIVGQAPGRKAQESGIPWNDVSGDTLRTWLGLSRKEFYNEDDIALVPMDFYFPGKGIHGDNPPRRGFAELWHPKILAEMPHIELIIPVGAFAQRYYLKDVAKVNLTETVKNFAVYAPLYIPLVHPSPLTFRWRAQNPWFESQVVPYAHERVHQILS